MQYTHRALRPDDDVFTMLQTILDMARDEPNRATARVLHRLAIKARGIVASGDPKARQHMTQLLATALLARGTTT